MTTTTTTDEATEPHVIEDHVRIYLDLNPEGTAWVFHGDPSTDPEPLYGLDAGPECDFGHRCQHPDHAAQMRRALNVDLPTATELLHMLAAAHGMTLVPTASTADGE